MPEYVVQHELDDEPTYVCPGGRSGDLDDYVTFSPIIPVNIRVTVAHEVAKRLTELTAKSCEGCPGTGIRDPADVSNLDGYPIGKGWHCVERCDICEKFPSDLEAAAEFYVQLRAIRHNNFTHVLVCEETRRTPLVERKKHGRTNSVSTRRNKGR